MTVALYPGSFDPATKGHIDVAERAAALFDHLIVAVYDIPSKSLLFTTGERVALVREALSRLTNVSVQAYTGLTVDFARKMGARLIVRGLRVSSDFEREFEMALMNQKLAPDIDSVFFMTTLEYEFISSSIIKEVCELGGCIDDLVPDAVATALREKFFGQVDFPKTGGLTDRVT